MPCPNGAYTLRANLTTSGCQHGVVMVGGVRYKNSRALTGACSGFTTGALRCSWRGHLGGWRGAGAGRCLQGYRVRRLARHLSLGLTPAPTNPTQPNP